MEIRAVQTEGNESGRRYALGVNFSNISSWLNQPGAEAVWPSSAAAMALMLFGITQFR
jgi:hypothetical protein